MSTEYTCASLFTLKRDKAAFRNLMVWLNYNAEVTEVVLAKSISSVITHICIEMEYSDTMEEAQAKAEGYKLSQWADILKQCLDGVIDSTEVMVKVKSLVTEV